MRERGRLDLSDTDGPAAHAHSESINTCIDQVLGLLCCHHVPANHLDNDQDRYTNTVEPLIMKTPNKEHHKNLYIKDTHQLVHFNLQREDNLSINDKMAGPNVSIIQTTLCTNSCCHTQTHKLLWGVHIFFAVTFIFLLR